MTDDGWEARMAARTRERAIATGVPRHGLDFETSSAQERKAQIAEHPERFLPEPPPGEEHCQRCSEWKVENSSMGRYAWWLICGYVNCDCACHPPKGRRILLA